MVVHRLYFFCNQDMVWNILDLCIVAQGLTEMVLSSMEDSSFATARLVRILRVGRIIRLFRLFRMIRFLGDLRVMLSSLASAAGAFFWSFVLIFLILYIFAILIVQQFAVYLRTKE